jgi:hypothetical protein
MADSYTFSKELAINYPTHGQALLEPAPGDLYDVVRVGDVGFIRNGYFTLLFNALDPKRRPSNSNPQQNSNYPPKLQTRMSNHIRQSRDDHKYFHSSNVTLSCGSEAFASE